MIKLLLSVGWFFAIVMVEMAFMKKDKNFLTERLSKQKGEKSLDDEEDPTSWHRLLQPLLSIIKQNIGSKFSQVTIAYIDKRLTAAGRPLDISAVDFQALKVLLAAVLGVLLFIISISFSGSFKLVLTVTGIVGGYLLPDIWLNSRLEARRNAITQQVTSIFDLLHLCTSAGMTIPLAIRTIVDKTEGVLTNELKRTMKDLDKGESLSEVFASLSKRCDTPEINELCHNIKLSQMWGTPVADTVRILSDIVRNRIQEKVKEKASKAAVNVFLPVLILIFPAIFLIALGPAIMKMLDLI